MLIGEIGDGAHASDAGPISRSVTLLVGLMSLASLVFQRQAFRKKRRSVDTLDLGGLNKTRDASHREASTSGASTVSDDQGDAEDDVTALFRVAQIAHNVSTSYELVPRRRGRRATVNLFVRTLEPPQARGVVLLLHGLNGHSGHGSNLWTAALLANRGYMVRAVDHEGHGRSAAEGSRVFFRDVDVMAADVADLLRDSKRKNPDLPHFLMGISFGGCLALKATLKLEPEERKNLITGLVLQCPFILPASESTPGPLLRAAAHALNALVPHLPIAGANRGRGANPAVQRKVQGLMESDPLCYKGKLRIGTAMALVAASDSLRKRLAEVDVPFLVQHGDADRVVAAEGSRVLHCLAVSADKTIEVYAGASHNLMHEIPETLSTVRGHFVAWLEARTLAAGGNPPATAESAEHTLAPGSSLASRSAAANAANAASLLLRRTTSSVPPETLLFAAAAIAALRASTGGPPSQGFFSPSASSLPEAELPLGGGAGEGSWSGSPKSVLPGHDGGLAGAHRRDFAASRSASWMLELRRTSSGISAATLLAHAAAVAEGRGRLGRA